MRLTEYTLTERPECAALLPDSYRTVLEVGCSKGGFRSSLGTDAEVWGIEPNPEDAKMAQAAGYKILVGIYDAVATECPDKYFDVIVCNDVIEHMIDHDAFLESIKVKLKPGGVIIGSVPNVRYFGNMYKLIFERDWQYVEHGILDRTHLRFFTEKSLARTFRFHGYDTKVLKGINDDFTRQLSLKHVGKLFLLMIVIALSFGHFRDFRFVQYGFRIGLK
jgi:2-polyprenyl-3-methyl-5-hydroxy-6-metoxy-1,4-benzoquinol methylase